MEDKVEVVVKIFKNNDDWHYHLQAGSFQSGGMGESLKEVEDLAYQDAFLIPNVGQVHTIYEDGKDVVPVNNKPNTLEDIEDPFTDEYDYSIDERQMMQGHDAENGDWELPL